MAISFRPTTATTTIATTAIESITRRFDIAHRQQSESTATAVR